MLPGKGGVPSASSEQSVGDVWIVQLDRKRVPKARSSGCKSSITVTAECSWHHASQLTTESAECCQTWGSNHLPSREAHAGQRLAEVNSLYSCNPSIGRCNWYQQKSGSEQMDYAVRRSCIHGEQHHPVWRGRLLFTFFARQR